MRTVFLALTCLVLANLAASNRAARNLAASEPPRFAYHDDHDGRVLADIRLVVHHRGGTQRLEMTVAAYGPRVAGIPGYRGMTGANRFTAEQFARLLGVPAALQVRTRGGDAEAPWLGSVRAGRTGTIAERRLLPSGDIDYLGQTAKAYPLELIVDAGPMTPGVGVTEIVVDGAPRLRVTYEARGGAVRLLSAESLGASLEPLGTGVIGRAPAVPGGEKPPMMPLPPPVGDAEWEARDADGKWVYYRRSVTKDEKVRDAWVQYLGKRQEFDFLEAIALYDDPNVVKKLAEFDAPQWIRLAAWYGQAANLTAGHGESMFLALLKDRDPPAVLSWLDKHKQALPSDGPLARIQNVLRKANHRAVTVAKYLPPLDARQAFRQLDAPAHLEEFGDRKRAEPGKAYAHHAEFALAGLVNSGKYEEPWLGKVRRLTRHADAKVRQAALLAYSHLLPFDPTRDNMLTQFLSVVDDRNETDRVREAALLALTNVDHPKITLAVLRLAQAPDHPAWRAAVSRLGDGAYGFALKVLDLIPAGRLSANQAALLKDARARLEKGLQSLLPQAENYLQSWLETVVWAQLTDHPLTGEMSTWTKDFFTQHGGVRVDAQLRALQRQFRAQHAIVGREVEFGDRVRALAGEIQAARTKDTP